MRHQSFAPVWHLRRADAHSLLVQRSAGPDVGVNICSAKLGSETALLGGRPA